MGRAVRKLKGPAPIANMDQEAVQQPQPQETATDVQRTSWGFDRDAAEALYEEAQKKAVAFVKLEHNLPLAMRALGKAIRAFVVTVMPDAEIDILRGRLIGKGVVYGNDVLPSDVIEFLRAKDLPLPHFNSVNPLQGIVAGFYQNARLSQQYTQVLQAQQEIYVASRPVTVDDLVGDAAKRLTAAQQTQQSKLGRWVLASIEMPENEQAKTGGERLFEMGFPAAIADWTEWREKNPDKVISATKPKPVRNTKAEKDAEATRREEQAEARRMQEMMAASVELSDTPPDEMLGGDVTDDATEPALQHEPEHEPVAIEAVVEQPEPKPTRWHAIIADDAGNHVKLKPQEAASLLGNDLLSELPDKGCLTFEVCDGSLVITGWEGPDKD